ncbi:hypothetical protein Hanom_Chr01g00028141 [Helianthus anomalus]
MMLTRKQSGQTRWSVDKECFVDPKGNPIVDPDKVDFEALVAAIPTVCVWCKGLEEIPNYRQKVDEGIKKVIYASLEKKKKTVEEIVDESQKMVEEVKKADKKTEEEVAEKQEVVEEDQIQKAKETTVPKTEVTQIESSEMLNKSEHKTAEQCKKWMETCRACTEKDNNLRYRDIEFTKIERILKEKCHEMLENERVLKEKEKELTQKCEDLEKKQNFERKVFS